MKESHRKKLEQVFAAEINNRLPYQTKGKVIHELEELGFVEPMKVVLPGRFPLTIYGWNLTHAGRIAYCATCK